MITIAHIIEEILNTYDGVQENTNWGERGLFYNPNNALAKGIYLLTFKENDGPNDKASNINRGNIYRLNLGLSKLAYRKLFGEQPKRPLAGQIVDTGHDFEAIDILTPHPIYGWMSWVAVLNPSQATFEQLKPLISDTIELAKIKYAKKVCKSV